MVDKAQLTFDLKWFLSNCHIYKYPHKSTLIHQGEKAKNLLYVIKGSVLVFIKDNEGKEIIIYNLKKGDFIGEDGLFNKIKRKYWVKALSSCEIAEISYKNFYRLIKVNSDIIIYLYNQISKRLQKVAFSEKYINLELFIKIGEVSKILLFLAKKPNVLIHERGLKLLVSSKEISNMTNLSQDVIDKILLILKSRKLIDIDKKNIILYDIPY